MEKNLDEKSELLKNEISQSLNINEYKSNDELFKEVEQQFKICEAIKNSEIPLNKSTMINPRLSHLENKQNIVKIDESNLDFVDIEIDHVKKPKDAIFDDICSICSRKIYYNKFVCIVCKNCILCENCEEEHPHPVMKCKINKISNLYDIYVYLYKHNKIVYDMLNKKTKKKSFFDFFNDNVKIKISTINTKFTMRKNKKLEVPIYIENLTNDIIEAGKNKFLLISRNSRDLFVNNKEIDQTINKKEQIQTSILVETNDVCKLYNFQLEMYCGSDIKLECNTIDFSIEVNEDEEEEELNAFFDEYPDIMILNKKNKEDMKYIMEKHITKEHPYVIVHLLKNNNWDKNKTINDLNSKKIEDENKELNFEI